MASFGLTLYSLTARKGAGSADFPARPLGQLVWLHLADASHHAGAEVLAQRLRADHGLQVVMSGGDLGPGKNVIAAPEDTLPAVQAHLAHFAPQVIVFLGATLRPMLIAQAQAQQVPMVLVEAGAPRLLRGSDRWFIGLKRQSVLAFHAVMTADETSARDYRRLGAANVTRLGRMEGSSLALPHNEAERSALAAQFATRPVWLAVDVPQAEEAAVFAAHRAALRLAHRLLLIFVPQDLSRAPELAARLEADEGWIVARRDADQEVDPETSVYLADAGQEYGLWYRLAPVTFMGGSLFGAGCARSPMEAAALGSAIIHGRKVGEYGSIFGRLGAALGAAPVSTAEELAEFLADLLAPDRAARLAHAAWAVASEGAEVTERVVQIAAHLATLSVKARGR